MAFNFIQAQTKFGATAGYTLSNLIDSEGQSFNMNGIQGKLSFQHGFYAGVFAEKKLNEKAAMHYELNYALLGGMVEAHITQLSSGFLGRINMHQLMIPVSIKYYLHPKWNIYAGPYAGIKLNSNFRLQEFYGMPSIDASDIMEDELSKELNNNLQSFSVGAFAGSEYKISNHFALNAKYNYGFTNLSTDKDQSLKIHFLQAGINYYFK